MNETASEQAPLPIAAPLSIAAVATLVSTKPDQDLNNPALYLNRELGWLQFNERVLSQATNPRNPLLERVKFLAISGSNMDEFFMKRIGGLKQQVAAGVLELSVDGRTPQQQLNECHVALIEYGIKREKTIRDLFHALRKKGIEVLDYTQLSKSEQDEMRDYFYDNIFPLVTPQSVDPAHPFPFISNLSLNLFITLRYPGAKEIVLARVKVPVGAGANRFQWVGTKGHRFVRLEEVMKNNLELLFPGMEIVDCELFRVTRNANTSKDEEHADDLLELIETTLQNRRIAPIVRMQVNQNFSLSHRGRLASELGLDEDKDVFVSEGMLGLQDLWEFYHLDLPELKIPSHHPVDHPQLPKERNIFHAIRDAKEILLQHPYESFTTSVERFLHSAATDPKVRGIKMTLYRTAAESDIIKYLIQAARNGKHVTVVVELQASFNEQTNVKLANRMEDAGIHVNYGVVGLKTHAKVILVLRQDYKGLRRYVHVGTGNYHPDTARLYSDFGLFIYDKCVGRDTTELFNYLTTGFTLKRNYTKLLPAPKNLKKSLLEKIERECLLHTDKSPGLIRMKMNALEDVDISRALYKAAQVGVKVELLIRDSCRVRPGLPGLSENIRVVSVLGRFLEHARIYYFQNNKNEEVLIGSADAMRRNLEFRVEILVPVTSAALRKQLCDVMDLQLKTNINVWELQSDGSYRACKSHNRGGEESQQKMIKLAEKRLNDFQRPRKKKTRQTSGKNKYQ